ncbi:MAG TPA: tRNA (adenosine(37)-N6)-dimethylallyltransferase MiaA [Acidimicrobiales bacterium]|nr:tRNA (adenosine(37)-N6)-dimethylallyltransferase MiaA [Acidimicrobiales bacterium]
MPRSKRHHVALVGPTGSGKSAQAMAIAGANPEFEIVSADAMCVYRGMDIGTDKPSPADRAAVPHHLVDIVEPAEDYTVARFGSDCAAAVRTIEQRGKRALLVGGTGLYVRAAVDGLSVPPQFPAVREQLEAEPDTAALYARLQTLDPDAATKMEPSNRRRIVRALEVCVGSGRPFSSYGPGLDTYGPVPFRLVGLWPSRDATTARIRARFERMLAAGFVAEVERLATTTVSRTARQALGYRQLFEHVEAGRPLEEAVADAVGATVRFARRQRAWFRRDPRIAWFPPDIDLAAVASRQNW